MRFAKVFVLNDNVEVLIKKVIVDGKEYGYTLTYITEDGNELITMSLTSTHITKKKMEQSFESVTKDKLIQIGMTLPTFKDIL